MPQSTKTIIYQLKVSLAESSPLIWRTIQVPSEMKLPQLHLTLQIVMGWENYHLHEFRIAGKVYVEPDPEDDHFGRDVLDERRVRVGEVLPVVGRQFEYIYDFGDDWHHEILVESISPAVPGKQYPVCLAGKESGPPEDVGGIYGYSRYLDALYNPRHEEHQAMLNWRGRFDSASFSVTRVNKTLREAFPVRARQAPKVPATPPGKSAPTAEEEFDSTLRPRFGLAGCLRRN